MVCEIDVKLSLVKLVPSASIRLTERWSARDLSDHDLGGFAVCERSVRPWSGRICSLRVPDHHDGLGGGLRGICQTMVWKDCAVCEGSARPWSGGLILRSGKWSARDLVWSGRICDLVIWEVVCERSARP